MAKAHGFKSSEVLRWTLADLARAIKEKQVSSVEVVQQLLDRIQLVNERLNAYITVLPDNALTAAEQADREVFAGNVRGPLHGVPIGLKDVIYTRGIRTTMGSAYLKDYVPDHSATVVERLERAGAIVLGKLHTHEFAFGPTGDRSYFGPARNPYDLNRITGGSSGGPAAAVASGLCYGALGSDAGGSVRIPAACCGIVGLKPTFGRVSTYGVFPLSWTLDHVGPMTRTIEDNAILLGVLSGHDDRDPHSAQRGSEDFNRDLDRGIRGSVIGIPRTFYFDNVEYEVETRVREAIEVFRDLGAKVRQVEIPRLSEFLQAHQLIVESEAYSMHSERLEEDPDRFGDELKERLLASESHRAYEYIHARQLQKPANEEFDQVLREVEILLTPTIPILPTEIGQRKIEIRSFEESVRSALTRFMRPTNLNGFPSLSVPCGFSALGLPIGLQLIGRPFDEANLYRFGYAFEQETGISTLKYDA
jgi:aspartyl-tRNA(Asn)/glutamyl-tRNA(Gln) amidotransferase subunit A